MFEIKIGVPPGTWNPNDPITSITYSEASLKVKDHSELVSHLRNKGITLGEVNFFKWQAFPNRSYGKFLVSEAEWIALVGVPPANKPRLASLTIADENGSKTFQHLEIVSTSFLMSPIYPTGAQFQDGSRILVIELEHNGMNAEYRRTERLYKAFDQFSDIEALFSNGIDLVNPGKYNRHNVPNVALVDYLAYIASSNFLTSYLPPGSSWARLAWEKFSLPSNTSPYQLLYSNVSTIDRPLKFNVVLKSDSVCKDDYITSDDKPIVLSDTVYRSPINANTEVDTIKVVIPYSMFDHIQNEYVANAAKDEANRIATAIVTNANNRLPRTIDLIYQGLVPGDITNDVQCITYYYQGKDYGVRTRLQSTPWEIHECILSHLDKCKDSIFRGVLLTNLVSGFASAIILRTKGVLEVVEYAHQIRDPIGVFSNIKKGSSVLLYKSCSGEYDNMCEYNIIQSECPGTEPSNTSGKCVITGYCYNTIQAVCSKLNGTWTAGAACSSTPFGS